MVEYFLISSDKGNAEAMIRADAYEGDPVPYLPKGCDDYTVERVTIGGTDRDQESMPLGLYFHLSIAMAWPPDIQD